MGRSSYVGPETLGNIQPPLSQRNKRQNRNLQPKCLVCIVVVVCIVAILCVFVVLCVYCCFYFRCRTAG